MQRFKRQSYLHGNIEIAMVIQTSLVIIMAGDLVPYHGYDIPEP
jgi:hypothetical protein